jgi:hypothetical protein
MRIVDGSTVLTMPDPVLVRKVHDEVVLLDMSSDQYYGLNAVGACVLEAIQAGADLDGAIVAVAGEFDGDKDQIDVDVRALVDDLVSSGLLVVTPT